MKKLQNSFKNIVKCQKFLNNISRIFKTKNFAEFPSKSRKIAQKIYF